MSAEIIKTLTNSAYDFCTCGLDGSWIQRRPRLAFTWEDWFKLFMKVTTIEYRWMPKPGCYIRNFVFLTQLIFRWTKLDWWLFSVVPEESQVGPGLNERRPTQQQQLYGLSSDRGQRWRSSRPRALSATFVAVTVVSRLSGVAAESSPLKYRHHSS